MAASSGFGASHRRSEIYTSASLLPGACAQSHRERYVFGIPFWPKAMLIVAWGNAPGKTAQDSRLAEGHIQRIQVQSL